MGAVNVKIADWKFVNCNRVKLIYDDGSFLYITRKAFNCSWKSITGGVLTKADVIHAYALQYLWKDIIKIGDKIYAEMFPISGDMDDDETFRIDEFISLAAGKYGVNEEDIQTYMLDGIEFDANALKLPFGAEMCGCYINGIPEWEIEE